MKRSLVKHFFLFPTFFIVFYMETITIGGVKLAVLWKIVLISIIVFYIINSKSINLKKFIFFGYLYSLKNFFNASAFVSPIYFVSALTEVIKSSFIPLLSHFFILLQKYKNIDIYKVLLSIAVYIILSTIPFLLGILKPLTTGYDLSLFGLKEYGFVGIFQIAHSAAVTIAFAIIVLIFALDKARSKKLKTFYLSLVLLGLWVEIQTYARTGFAVVFLSGAYLLLINKGLKHYFKIFIPLLLLGIVAITYYYSSETLQMRVEGTNIYLKQSGTESDLGSGRFKFLYHAIDNWSSSNYDAIFLGLGIEKAMDMMEKDVGLRIYAHNGFADVLQFNGIVGLWIYSMFLFYLVHYVRSKKYSPFYRLNIALVLAYLVSTFFQGEHFFLADVILASGLALLAKEEKE